MKVKKLFLAILIVSFFIIPNYLFSQGLGNTISFPSADDTDGVYYATTDDGVKLVVKRYRPFKNDEFNKGKQPVILFNGIAASMYDFMVRTTAETKNLYRDFELDKDKIAEWAKDDIYVQKDPMLYYSIAYYLWKFGYDVWLSHYRGTGVGALKSELNSQGISLDQWIVYDGPAIIDKVYEITNIPPIIGGHSTGGFVSYGYLQGAYFDEISGHVRNSKELAEQRNNFVRGFIALDPAGNPPLPQFINLPPIWSIVGLPIFLPVGDIISVITNNTNLLTPGNVIEYAINLSMRSVYGFDQATFGRSLFQYLSMLNTDNMNKYLVDFYVRYFTTGFPLRGYGQYYDNGMNRTIREFWKNGSENTNKVVGPKPAPNDGYYYYIDNMDLIKVPTITILSESESLVNVEGTFRDIINRKNSHILDEWMVVPNSGHVDLVISEVTAKHVYYYLRNWLNRMQAAGYIN